MGYVFVPGLLLVPSLETSAHVVADLLRSASSLKKIGLPIL
jgi:hypothetical protein